ncbi:SAM-dependent methyltransferase, partial [Actinomyces oris]|uniref:SAM-dependent methyltransferase n=1 Tax=Actinomyces oris TaxID=544580 RepID=UPI000AB7B8AC
DVVAVDVGYGQLAWSLRSDPRVTALDRTNIRTLDPEVVAPAPELVVGDLSFISLTLVLEPLLRAAADDADLLLMVKPQFEVGKDRVGHGGVVRDPELHVATVMTVAERAHALGVGVEAVTASPLPGPAGNVEYFLSMHASRAGCPGDLSGDELRSSIEDAVAAGPAAGGARRRRTRTRP